MAPDGAPPGPTRGDLSEESTLADGDWPVDDHYFVEPDPEPARAELERIRGDERGQIAPPVAARSPSRAVALGLSLILLALVLAAAAGAWIAFRPGSNDAGPAAATPPPSRSGGQAATSSSSTTTTTTPVAPSKTVAVPDTTGLASADARSRLEAAGLRVRIRQQTSATRVDHVLEQSPRAGSEARRSSLVVLTVSSGPGRVSVPELVGLSADAAARRLRDLKLVPQLRLVRSTRPAGRVLAEDPAPGTRTPRGRSVRLDVAKNVPVARVRVPDLGGLTVSAARSKLATVGLHASAVQVESSRARHTVVDQLPEAGAEVRKGGTVRLSVSSGPAKVAVPSVVGLDEQSAQDELQARGFQVRVVNEPSTDPSQDGMVSRQDPQGGTEAKDGSTVTITVDRLS